MMRISRAFVALIVGLPLVAPPRAAAQDERPVLELSLQDAVDRALQNNLDIMIAKFNPDSSAQSVRGAQGAAYDPFLSGQFNQFSTQSQASNSLAGGANVKTDRFTYNFTASQYVPTGGRFQLDFNNYRQTSNSNLSTFDPLFNSSLTLSLTQPLLRGFSLDAPRQQILVARKNREISDVQFHETVVNTVASVKQLYWELIFAIDNLEAQRTSLGLAGKFLNENQIKVKVGTMAPLDVVQAQSEVARVEGDVITAENALYQAEDRLKQAIIPKNDPATWAVRIVPKDRPTAEPIRVDVEAAIAKALGQRTDVVAARKGVERANINLDYAKSLARPQMDLVATYGSSGVGGTLLTRNPPFGGPVVSTTPGGYGDALSSVFGRDNPTWTLGVNVSYPIGNRQASASRAQAQIAREQAEVSLRRLELQIALDVRTAGRSVETNSKLVQATQAARLLQEQRLDAEDKKFAAGMSTNFLVTQAQRDLALARVQELRAIANYRESLINFERVQEAGGGGSSIAISTGSSGISSFNSSSSSSSAASNSGSNQ